MSDAMKTEQLQPGQGLEELGAGGQPALGATHEANREPSLSDPRRSAQALAELVRQGVEVVESPQERGGGEGRTEEETRLLRQWRRDQITRGSTEIDGAISAVKARLQHEPLDAPERITSQGHQLETSLGEVLRELLLARMIYYPTAVEAALALRDHELIVQGEIDQLQQLEGGVGIADTPFIVLPNGTPGLKKQGGAPYTVADYFLRASETQKLIENPPELQEFRRTLEKLEKQWGGEYLRRMARRFRNHELVGLTPNTRDLPLYVPLSEALWELKKWMPEDHPVDETLVRQFQLEEDMKRKAELAKQLNLGGFAQEGFGGESYLKMYREAWEDFVSALKTFPDEVKDEIVANFIVGGSMLGSSFSSFYKKALELQYGRGPSAWSAWFDAIEHFQKVSSVKGYIPPEHIFQALGSVKPEVIGFPDFHTSRHELWLPGDQEPRRFSISSRDVIGHLMRQSTLSRMSVNDAYASETGFFAVRNGEFAEYCYRQMGYSPDLARKMSFGKAAAPTVMVRDRYLSPTSRLERTHLDDWIGEVVLDKLIVAMAWIKYTRADLEFLPLDAKRREILSMRGLELAHYRIGYSIGLPPEQFLNMIALFGSAISLDHKEMLFWVTERLNPLAHKSSPEQSGGTEQQKLRERMWRETITLNRPSLASTRHLARMAQGVGKYNLSGDEYRRAIHEGMQKIPQAYVEAARHPDIWKWKWYERVDQDPNQWRYIGHLTGGPSEDAVRAAFDGYDFTEELRACGLSEGEIRNMSRVGYDGWKSLLQHATFGLLEWAKCNYTTGDKTWRYQGKKEKTQDATIKLLETSNPNVPDSLDDILKIDPGIGELADIPGRAATYQRKRQSLQGGLDPNLFEGGGVTQAITEAFSKILEPISDPLGFVLNSTQQAYLESIVWMYMEGHCAQRLDTFVEDTDVRESKFAGGVNWSVPILKRSDINRDRIPALQSEGFYFQQIPELGDDYLISPIDSPLPCLIQAGHLLGKISRSLEGADGGMKDHAAHVLDAIELMRRENAFCWDTLINARADIPPATIISALNEVKEEGAMTASAKRAICSEALRFYKTHPDGAVQITDKMVKLFVPKLSK